ncbi:hypothetical protein GGS21DRAFT_18454 [Xylaria nigripes]|nr:hypothetical protein GGS21DRAFT_18454 [Xylaria nigripes]
MFFPNGTGVPSVPMRWPTAVLNVYTTVYETVLPAACETSSWMATYRVTETCYGNPGNYVTPTIPPGFVVTTVSCNVCAQTEMEITCPGAQPTGMGKPTVHIEGNGVTATMTAMPSSAPPRGGMPGATAAPTHGGITPGNPGQPANNGMDSCHGNCNSNNNNNNSMVSPPKPYTGEAMTLKGSLVAGAGLAFLIGPLLLV